MTRVALAVMLAACSDPAVVPDAGVDAPADAALVDELVVSPVGYDFGSYNVGSGAAPTRFTFTIANRGQTAASLTAVTIGGAATADFTIAANDCGAMLAIDETCNVRVEFVATTAGDREAVLQIAGSTSATAALSGKGIAPPSRIRFMPSARNFGDVASGATGAPFTFTVTNEAAPTMLTASLRGAGAAGFRIASTDCMNVVVPLGGTCTITVEMVPPYGGQYVAEVALTASDGSVAKAGLTGASTTPLTVGPYTGLFDSFLIGQPTAGEQITFTVTNTGTTTTGPITATPIGAAAVDFTVRSTTCTTLAPAEMCSVVVEATPLTRGAKYAELSVTDAVAEARSTLRGNAYSLLITGTASFPDTASGQQSALQTFTVSNASDLATGPVAVTRGGADASQFTIVSTNCAVGIAPHTGCMIAVRFTPTTTGMKSATLNVSATPGGSDSRALSGRGL